MHNRVGSAVHLESLHLGVNGIIRRWSKVLLASSEKESNHKKMIVGLTCGELQKLPPTALCAVLLMCIICVGRSNLFAKIVI